MAKPLDRYDYKEAGELTTTITLAEYRDLVKTSTRHDFEMKRLREEHERDTYKLKCEVTKLKQQIKQLTEVE